MDTLDRAAFAIGMFLFAAAPGAAVAQRAEVPEPLQAVILAKALTFDRTLGARAGDTLVIAVLAQARVPESRRAAELFTGALRTPALATIAGIPVVTVSLSADGPVDELWRRLVDARVDIAYIPPLRGIDVASIAATLRQAAVFGMTGVEAYVAEGIPLGVGMRRGHPILVLNLPAARGVFAEFGAQLLKLAQVIE